MRKPSILTLGPGLVFLLVVFLCPADEDAFAEKRRAMVTKQLKGRDITDSKVLEAMERVPRHLFVASRYRSRAYEDYPLPIAEGQTISQPYIVALMTQSLQVRPGQRVLEVGTGSGYQAAVLACLTENVFSVEIREALAEEAAGTLERLNFETVRVKGKDGYFGWEEQAPFDAILVACAANHLPPPLFKQLKEGGKLVIPLGSTLYYQNLTLITKDKGQPKVRHLLDVRFVPMTGEIQKK